MTQPLPKVTSDQGFNQIQHTFGRKMPQRLYAAGNARRGLRNLMRGKGRG
jgi:hypothetical protein